MKIGSDEVTSMYVGSDEASKLYIGNDLAWEKASGSAPEPDETITRGDNNCPAGWTVVNTDAT